MKFGWVIFGIEDFFFLIYFVMMIRMIYTYCCDWLEIKVGRLFSNYSVWYFFVLYDIV